MRESIKTQKKRSKKATTRNSTPLPVKLLSISLDYASEPELRSPFTSISIPSENRGKSMNQ